MKHKLFTRILAATFAALLLVGLLAVPAGQILAASASAKTSSVETIEKAGLNFLKTQYKLRGISYTTIAKKSLVPLYDDINAIVGYVLIVDRDGHTDYVVLDTLMKKIDEYGFDSAEFAAECRTAERVLYAGPMNFARKDKGETRGFFGEKLDENQFKDSMSNFKALASRNALRANGYDGIISWGNIADRMNGIYNSQEESYLSDSEYAYLPGIDRADISGNIKFMDQNELNRYYREKHGSGITGSCGPTAMTNMFIYFDKLAGFTNALVNDSPYDTFDSMIQHSGFTWNWNGSTWWNNTQYALKTVAKQQGYNYNIYPHSKAKWNDFKYDIKNLGIPVYAYFGVGTDNGSYWAHAVVVLGVEEFAHRYATTQSYWLFGWRQKQVWHTDYYQYLRIVDGWSTANASRYVDLNGYYDSNGMLAIGFTLR